MWCVYMMLVSDFLLVQSMFVLRYVNIHHAYVEVGVYLWATEACSARKTLAAVIRGLHAVMLLKACRTHWQRARGGQIEGRERGVGQSKEVACHRRNYNCRDKRWEKKVLCGNMIFKAKPTRTQILGVSRKQKVWLPLKNLFFFFVRLIRLFFDTLLSWLCCFI